ncbi:MAG: hypothetical protein Q9202_002870 [Teloschistes flavicans]
MTEAASQRQILNDGSILTESKLVIPSPIDIPKSVNGPKNGHLNLDTFSPVNQNGSFEFDRVLKCGEVHKQTKNTKQWKKSYLVLRPNLLSVYKSPSEERLYKQISLSDLNAVAQLKDRKGRRDNLFGLYTPARNYQFQAREAKDAKAWVELIRREARIDEDEHKIHHGSRDAVADSLQVQVEYSHLEHERFASSSPEPSNPREGPCVTRDGIRIPGARRPSTHGLEYSGDDVGTYSDCSDAPQQSYAHAPSTSFVHRKARPVSGFGSTNMSPIHQETPRNASRSSGFQIQDEERVVWHGYLLILRSKGGVRQWKKLWAVLRSKNLAFYKSDEEYAAQLILPLSNVINAVEIDPLSKSKSHCMQIIAEDKTFRFCAPSEEALTKWLGALKSQLARMREARNETAH